VPPAEVVDAALGLLASEAASKSIRAFGAVS
jgi:hypothetical protein